MPTTFDSYAGGRSPGQQERTPIEAALIRGWDGGWQPDLEPLSLEPNMIEDLMNMEFTEGFGLRKRKGFEKVTTDIAGTKTVTTVNRGTATGGTFTLTYFYVNGFGTTAAIAFDASAATVEAAVEATSAIIAATVTGTGTSGDPWVITIDEPITSHRVSGTSSLSDGSLTVNQTTVGLSQLDTAGYIIIEGMEQEIQNYPRNQQHVLYINESDGMIWHASLGSLLKEESDGGGSDLARTGFALGRHDASNGPRPYSVQAIVSGENIYVTSQRVAGTSGNGTTIQTHDGTDTTHTKPFKYDASTDTWSSLAPHLLAGGTSGFPTARCLLNQYDTIFAANVVRQAGDASDYKYRSRIYWSTPGTVETWSATAFITVGSDEDGTDITSMTPFREAIVVLKGKSFWMLTGTDTDTFALYNLSEVLGSESTDAVAADERFFYFFDTTEGVVTYDGANFVNISEPINAHILSLINRNAIFKVNLWLDEYRLYVSIPIGGFASGSTLDHNTRTFVYDKRTQIWSQYSIGMVPQVTQDQPDGVLGTSDQDLLTGAYYTGGIADEVGLQRWASTDSDNGTTIAAFFKTAWLNPGEVGDKHRLRRIEFIAADEGDVVDVSLYRNFSTVAWKTGTFTPTTGTIDSWHEQQPNYDGELWSWLQIKLDNDTDAETFQVDGMAFSYSTRSLRRSDLGVT